MTNTKDHDQTSIIFIPVAKPEWHTVPSTDNRSAKLYSFNPSIGRSPLSANSTVTAAASSSEKVLSNAGCENATWLDTWFHFDLTEIYLKLIKGLSRLIIE